MRQVSLHIKAKQVIGLLGTDDLNAKDTSFVEGLEERGADKDSTYLSGPQAKWLDDLWSKHFA
jgi:hypothetical protein